MSAETLDPDRPLVHCRVCGRPPTGELPHPHYCTVHAGEGRLQRRRPTGGHEAPQESGPARPERVSPGAGPTGPTDDQPRGVAGGPLNTITGPPTQAPLSASNLGGGRPVIQATRPIVALGATDRRHTEQKTSEQKRAGEMRGPEPAVSQGGQSALVFSGSGSGSSPLEELELVPHWSSVGDNRKKTRLPVQSTRSRSPQRPRPGDRPVETPPQEAERLQVAMPLDCHCDPAWRRGAWPCPTLQVGHGCLWRYEEVD